jgi:hypothetical protein
MNMHLLLRNATNLLLVHQKTRPYGSFADTRQIFACGMRRRQPA